MKRLKKLTLDQRAWLHFKIALGIIWPALVLLSPPEAVSETFSFSLIVFWMLVSAAGCLISILGYMMFHTSLSPKARVIGGSIELAGLIMFSVGPFLLFFTVLGSTVSQLIEGVHVSLSGVGFSYAICAVLIYRFTQVVPRFFREARDPNKEV